MYDMAPTCTHDHAAPPPEEVVRRSLNRAELKTIESGQRWTEPRRRVYELLLKAGGPVKAYDLMEVYSEVRTAKPPTVYRALDHLEQIGLVHRIASLNAYVACAEEGGHVPAFLICDCCGSAQEFEAGQVRTARDAARQAGFTPRAIGVEVRGRCARCG